MHRFPYNQMLIFQCLLSELEQVVAPDSEVVDEASGKKIGTVNIALGSCGMGLLRLQEALKHNSSLGSVVRAM
jgi:hypothetical protein